MANFINCESCSTICINLIWIDSPAPENQTRLFLLIESEFFGQNMADVIKCGYHGNDTAANPNMAVFVHPPR